MVERGDIYADPVRYIMFRLVGRGRPQKIEDVVLQMAHALHSFARLDLRLLMSR